MAANPGVGEQLKGMLDAFRRYEEYSNDTMAQSSDVSCLSLVWPLLPLLPPQPPALVTELLRKPEVCDICGSSQGKPLLTCSETSTGVLIPAPLSSTGLRNRTADERKTPLDLLMADIEMKMDKTLRSIESTTKKDDKLCKERKELEQCGKSDLSDAEMLKRLKSLADEKAKREEKVKTLEVKEKQLKESLMTAINWAKSIETKGNHSASEKDAQEETDNRFIQPIGAVAIE